MTNKISTLLKAGAMALAAAGLAGMLVKVISNQKKILNNQAVLGQDLSVVMRNQQILSRDLNLVNTNLGLISGGLNTNFLMLYDRHTNLMARLSLIVSNEAILGHILEYGGAMPTNQRTIIGNQVTADKKQYPGAR